MKVLQVAVGGVVAGLIIVAGEAVLNVLLLADEWAQLLRRLALPEPTPAAAAQVPLKLLLLGIFAVWLGVKFKPADTSWRKAGIIAGLVVWSLVWAWVPWGLLLSGYMSPAIAAATVAWGLIELPVAVCAGTSVYGRLARPVA